MFGSFHLMNDLVDVKALPTQKLVSEASSRLFLHLCT